MSGEKYVNKIFLLFSGSGSAEVSPNETIELRELSVEITPAEDFFMFNPPPTWISRVFDPSSRKNFKNPISPGDVDVFWNDPFWKILKLTFNWFSLGLQCSQISLAKMASEAQKPLAKVEFLLACGQPRSQGLSSYHLGRDPGNEVGLWLVGYR